MKKACCVLTCYVWTLPALAEAVRVEHGPSIGLDEYECHVNPLPSFLKRYCYNTSTHSMLVMLGEPQRWVQYCNVPTETYRAFEDEPHKDAFYIGRIKGVLTQTLADCLTDHD